MPHWLGHLQIFGCRAVATKTDWGRKINWVCKEKQYLWIDQLLQFKWKTFRLKLVLKYEPELAKKFLESCKHVLWEYKIPGFWPQRSDNFQIHHFHRIFITAVVVALFSQKSIIHVYFLSNAQTDVKWKAGGDFFLLLAWMKSFLSSSNTMMQVRTHLYYIENTSKIWINYYA